MSDIKPQIEKVLHKNSEVTKIYESRLHQDKQKNRKTFIPQSDNIFNFDPPEQERPKKKKYNGEYPSQHYQNFANRGLLSNQTGPNARKHRNYEGKQNRDNIKDFIGENADEKNHKTVQKQDKTNVQKLLENNELLYPPKYREPTGKPGNIDPEQLITLAKSNIGNIKKKAKKDF